MNDEVLELNLLELLAIFLAGLTSAIHLYLAPQIGLNILGISFVIAGIGFIAIMASITLNYRKNLAYLLGVPFTLGQIMMWYYLNKPQLEALILGKPLLDAVDKASQGLLIIILIFLYYRNQ